MRQLSLFERNPNECGHESFIMEKQVFKNGTVHHRRTCEYCGKFLGYQQTIKNDVFKMPFGKHKGKPIVDAVKDDTDYFVWLLDNMKLSAGLSARIEMILEENKKDEVLL